MANNNQKNEIKSCSFSIDLVQEMENGQILDINKGQKVVVEEVEIFNNLFADLNIKKKLLTYTKKCGEKYYLISSENRKWYYEEKIIIFMIIFRSLIIMITNPKKKLVNY